MVTQTNSRFNRHPHANEFISLLSLLDFQQQISPLLTFIHAIIVGHLLNSLGVVRCRRVLTRYPNLIVVVNALAHVLKTGSRSHNLTFFPAYQPRGPIDR